MDWNLVLFNLTRGVTPEFVVSFYILALLGMLFSALLHKMTHRIIHKRSQPKGKTTHTVARFIANLIAVYVFILFHEHFTNSGLTMFIAFVVGLTIDKIILLIQSLKIG
jgi:hypothetical protein